MTSHNGMRPQDIAVLLKIIQKKESAWQGKDLAAELFISPGEISNSLERNVLAGLINLEKKKVHILTFLEFIQYGLHVVFPVTPGGITNGLPTAHSHPFMAANFSSNDLYVWPDITSSERGQTINPLYKGAIKAAKADQEFYKLLALLDVIRVGKVREWKVAIEELKRIITHAK